MIKVEVLQASQDQIEAMFNLRYYLWVNQLFMNFINFDLFNNLN